MFTQCPACRGCFLRRPCDVAAWSPRCSAVGAAWRRQGAQQKARQRKGQKVRASRLGATAASASQSSFDEADLEVLPRSPAATGSAEELQAEEAVEAIEEIENEVDRGEGVAAFVLAAAAFNLGIWAFMGPAKAEEFFAGYLLEQSLSVDNLFVFIIIFTYFQTPRRDQDKVLAYGIATAAVLRLVMIGAGATLIERFQPTLLAFAAVLLFSAYKIVARGDDDQEEDLSSNSIVRLCRRFIPVSDQYDGNRFFTLENGVRKATPLLLVLAVVEISDVVFAVDSIPAVFGVTRDPFIIWTSNMFAIASLRALYGLVSTVLSELRFLEKAIAIVLAWIGAKMIIEVAGFPISTELSLGVVASTLSAGVAASLLLPEAQAQAGEEEVDGEK
ncbi:hypothetical protein WJX81_006466 [Elliptochloris bilobata]|uniref:Uncharacterized protein n=1 Tax=Elliptochloris bilobata TaxID=381761 RepID=A0AAW1RXY9_9CHLO